MVIILVRRFVRADKEAEFLKSYRAQQPLQNPAFISETLTRVVEDTALPGGLRSLPLNGISCVTYLNVAHWQSWEAFAEQFADALASASGFDAEIETAPRQRAVLHVISEESN